MGVIIIKYEIELKIQVLMQCLPLLQIKSLFIIVIDFIAMSVA